MKATFLFTVFFLTVALHAQPIFFSPNGWVLGTEFPGMPQQSERRTPKPEGDIVETRAFYQIAPNETLGMARIQNPVPVPKDRLAAAYNGAKNGMLGATGARLISEEKVTILGRDSRRYICDFNSGALVCEQRMIIIGNEMFIFMYVHPKDAKVSQAASAFFARISDKKS